MTLAVRVVKRWKEAKKLDLALEGLAGLAEGRPVTLYHGTTKLFRTFDTQQSRDALVDRFYGKGIFLTPSKRVAEQYAEANRNIGFTPSIIMDLKRKNPTAGSFLQNLYENGNEAWETEAAAAGLEPGAAYAEGFERYLGGVDPNTIGDIAGYIVGSKLKSLEQDGDGPINIFNLSTGAPDWVYNSLDEVGLDSKTYRPKVYTVSVTTNNPLITAKQSEARKAQSMGYDCVVYYGSDLVGGVPEVAVFDPRKVKVKHIEVV